MILLQANTPAIAKGAEKISQGLPREVRRFLEFNLIKVKTFEITAVDLPVVHFRVVCSTGTYIRSLAQDYGAELGCGAYLSSLVRTRIGDFTLDQSMTMEQVATYIDVVKTGAGPDQKG